MTVEAVDWLLTHVWALLWTALTALAWGLDAWIIRALTALIRRRAPRRTVDTVLYTLGDLRRAWERICQQTAFLLIGGIALLLPGTSETTILGLLFFLLFLFPQVIAVYGALLDWQELQIQTAASPEDPS